MTSIKLSKEDIVNLVRILKALFPEYIRIEVRNTSTPYILFSKVKKYSIYNVIGKKLLMTKISLVELFIREVPKRLSIYQFGNDTNTPIYWATAAILIADQPTHLVNYFKECLDGMVKSTMYGEPYAVTKNKIERLTTNIGNGEYLLLKGILKTANPEILPNSNLLENLITE